MTAVVASVGVVLVAAVAFAATRRKKGGAGAGMNSSAQERLEKELARAAAVEQFEQALSDDGARAGPALARMQALDNETRLRLSAESLNLVGILLAGEGQHRQALSLLDQSLERDDAYFKTLNAAIAFEVLRGEGVHPELPAYPYRLLPSIDLEATTLLRAQLLHNLEQPDEVERVLAPMIAKPHFRYLRAECRRLSGRNKEALSDYKEIPESAPEYADAQQWIAQLTGLPPVQKPAAPAPGEKPVEKTGLTADKMLPIGKPAAAPKAPGSTSDRVPPVPKAAAGTTSDRVPPVARPSAPVPPPAPPPAPPPPAQEPPAEEPSRAEEPPRREPRRALATPHWNNAFDPRAVLGVGPSATLDEIRSAYLTLTKLNHPDRVMMKSPKQKAMAEEKMRDINRAWRELTREESPV